MKSKYLIPAALAAVVLTGYLGAKTVSANGYGFGDSAMVTSLAAKLGVSEDKVKEAFAAIRAEHQAEMNTQYEAKLNQAVTDGKISGTQKQLILEKHSEMTDSREAGREKHEEFRTWVENEGIDPSLIFGFGGKGMGRGMHR